MCSSWLGVTFLAGKVTVTISKWLTPDVLASTARRHDSGLLTGTEQPPRPCSPTLLLRASPRSPRHPNVHRHAINKRPAPGWGKGSACTGRRGRWAAPTLSAAQGWGRDAAHAAALSVNQPACGAGPPRDLPLKGPACPFSGCAVAVQKAPDLKAECNQGQVRGLSGGYPAAAPNTGLGRPHADTTRRRSWMDRAVSLSLVSSLHSCGSRRTRTALARGWGPPAPFPPRPGVGSREALAAYVEGRRCGQEPRLGRGRSLLRHWLTGLWGCQSAGQGARGGAAGSPLPPGTVPQGLRQVGGPPRAGR